MSRGLKGPSAAARENLGALFPVVGAVTEDGREMLILGCPGAHLYPKTAALASPRPKKARCKLCPPPECGATSPAGTTCSLRPGHQRSSSERLHERDGRRWAGDARASAKTP